MAKNKPVIAVDIDDVLAAEAEFIIEYSNRHWGHTLSLEEYHEHWGELWGVDLGETERRAEILHQPGVVSAYRLIERGREVLQKLSAHYRLVVVTSRRATTKQETLDWLEQNFSGLFGEIRFTGFFDTTREDRHLLTKAEILQELGCDFLIDDQVKHCLAAADVGIKAVLFGSHAISRDMELPAGVTRCKDWTAVEEYFDGLGS